MPAPDYETLYDFESQFDAALKAILDPYICATHVPTNPLEEFATPYLNVEFNMRSTTGPGGTPLLSQVGADPQIYPEAYEGQIVANLITDRIKGQEVNRMRGRLRLAMSPQAQSFNETTLPWLIILAMEENNSAREVSAEQDTDTSALTYRVIFAIRPDARPEPTP